MYELFTIGIDEKNIKFMIESNPYIMEMSEEEIQTRIELLKQLGLDENKIRNVIIGNPWYLDRCITDVIACINKLDEIGLKRIDLMVNDNPYLLNIDVFEIEDYINRKLEENYDMDDILDMIEENPNVISE